MHMDRNPNPAVGGSTPAPDFRKAIISLLFCTLTEILFTQYKDAIRVTQKQDDLLRNQVNDIPCHSLCYRLLLSLIFAALEVNGPIALTIIET